MNAASFYRMIDVLKGTWIYKLKAGEDRNVPSDFSSSEINEVVYEEEHNIPTILIILKDGTRRVGHPTEFSMPELEALTFWGENLRNNPR